MNLKAHTPAFPWSLISALEMFESGVSSLTLGACALALRAVPPHVSPCLLQSPATHVGADANKTVRPYMCSPKYPPVW